MKGEHMFCTNVLLRAYSKSAYHPGSPLTNMYPFSRVYKLPFALVPGMRIQLNTMDDGHDLDSELGTAANVWCGRAVIHSVGLDLRNELCALVSISFDLTKEDIDRILADGWISEL